MFDESWTDFADVVLSQEAMLASLRFGAPDPMAGLHVGLPDVEQIIGELTDGDLSGNVREQWSDTLELARKVFVEELGGTTRFAAIVRAAQLSVEDAEVFALLCAVEVDSRRQRLLVYIQDDVTRMWPTNETLFRAFGPDHLGLHSLAPGGRLRRAALLRPVSDDEPWSRQMARLESAVVWHLLGTSGLDPGLPPGTQLLARDDTSPRSESDDDAAALVLVTGPDQIRRRQCAFAELHGDVVLVTPVAEDDEWPTVVRQATLSGVPVLVEGPAPLSRPGREWIERADHLSWAISSVKEIPIDAIPSRPWIERKAPEHEVDDVEWAHVLGGMDRRGHRLSAEHLHQVRTVGAGLDGSIDTAVRRLASGLLDGLATRIRPRRTWSDLVLPARHMKELHDLCERYRLRGQVYDEWGFQAVPSAGLVALFAGSSGTGKTMTAEVVAGDLGLDLYRVDLSAITSKWVGETEKNLERIFSAASAGNLVLFFDEADAVFGKRSEVKEANDRYANLEVSYLLQRLETYDGLVILATNLQNNIDKAFMRRVHMSIDFQIPNSAERRKIWERCLPASAPTADIDLDLLAERFDIAGGNIRSAALTAAFLAATLSDEPITMEHVMRGLHREMRKLGRLSTDVMFGPYANVLLDEPDVR